MTVYYVQPETFNQAFYHYQQACSDLYSASECAAVTNALQAVELDQSGRCSGGTEVTPACAVPDYCPDDANKTEPGDCGCGVPEGTCGCSTTPATSSTAGYVTTSSGGFTDYCQSANLLMHYYCSNGNVARKVSACASWCANGTCLKS